MSELLHTSGEGGRVEGGGRGRGRGTGEGHQPDGDRSSSSLDVVVSGELLLPSLLSGSGSNGVEV